MGASYNELIGLGSHSADSRLHYHLNGDANFDGTGDTDDRMGNFPGFSTGDLTFASPRFGSGKSLVYNTGPANTGASESSALTSAYAANFSVALHAKPNALAQASQVLYEMGGSTRGHALVINTSGNAASYVTNGAATYISNGGSMNTTSWVFLAMTFDHANTVHRITQDGTAYDTGVTGNKTSTGGNDGALFGVNSNAAPGGSIVGDFAGELFDVTVWRGALTEAEEQQLRLGPEPLNTVAPTLSGTEEVGETLTCTTGTWDSQSNGTVIHSYQWTRSDDGTGTNEADISGATSGTYTLQAADSGKYIRCRVRGSNDGGFDPAEDTNSNFTAAIAPSSGGGGATLSGTASGQASASGTLSATGILSGSASGTASVSATLSGGGAVSGSASGQSQLDSVLSAIGLLSGSANATGALSGTLRDLGSGAISGTASATSTASGTLTATGRLSGTASATASPSGTLVGSGRLSGLVTAVASSSATASATGRLSGTLAGVATVSGTLSDSASTPTAGFILIRNATLKTGRATVTLRTGRATATLIS